MKNTLRLLPAVLLILSASVASAQPILGTPTGLASTAQTFNFEGFADGTAASNQYTGVSFGAGLVIHNYSYFASSGGAVGSLTNFASTGGYTSPFNIYFTQAVYGAAFQYVSNTGTTLFEAYLNNALVSSYSATTSTAQLSGSTPEFFGFDNMWVDRVQVYTETGVNGAMTLDNLEVGTTAPEPATVTLVATGLLGVFGAARRRRNSQA